MKSSVIFCSHRLDFFFCICTCYTLLIDVAVHLTDPSPSPDQETGKHGGMYSCGISLGTFVYPVTFGQTRFGSVFCAEYLTAHLV